MGNFYMTISKSMPFSFVVQRVQEIQKVIDVLERLDQGSLTQDFNNVTGRVSLDTKIFQQRLDLNHIAIHGHSFGAATAIVASGVDRRIKCCVGEDVWWSPVEEVWLFFV